jgi:hypothetical protein
MENLVLFIFSSFQEEHLERYVYYYGDVLNEVPTSSRIKEDLCGLYVTLLCACQSEVGWRILMEKITNKSVTVLDLNSSNSVWLMAIGIPELSGFKFQSRILKSLNYLSLSLIERV